MNQTEKIKSALSSYPFPFADFIESLKRQGFIIGIDHYLRLLQVLEKFGPDSRPERLKYLLCPVFATGEKQQRQFYRLFDRYLSLTAGDDEAAEGRKKESPAPEPEKPPVNARLWPYWVAGGLLIILAGVLAWVWHPGAAPEKVTVDSVTVPNTGSKPGEAVKRLPNVIITVPLDLTPPQEQTPIQKTPPKQKQTFYQQYGYVMMVTAAAVPLIIVLLLEIYQSGRRKFALQKGQRRLPPFVWPIQVEAPRPAFFRTKDFYAAAGRLRRRIKRNVQRLDVDASVRETVAGDGYPVLCYKNVTRPPEYLVLIDLSRFNDHYARFTDELVTALKDEGVFVHRYFYDRDPNICFQEPGAPRQLLSDIMFRYTRHRLILTGDGSALADPLSGELLPSVKIFRAWPERVLLSVRPLSQWGMGEVRLAREFWVLPAKVESLAAAVRLFERPEDNGTALFPERAAPEHQPLSAHETDLDKIKGYLEDASLFGWLCACAVYPELNWSLTLHLGGLMMKEVKEAQILRLVQLPWFRSGALPDDLRVKLIDCLSAEQLKTIRRAVFEVVKADPPPEGSAAREMYELNLAVEKWMVSPDKQKYLKEIKEKQERVVRDYALVRLLDAGKLSLLNLELPSWLRKRLFRKGVALFGVKTGVRFAAALVLSLLIYMVFPEPPPMAVQGMPRSVMFEFAHIPKGTFKMGSPKDEPGRYDNEIRHQVTITKDFYMQTTEVTQEQWQAVMGSNPSSFQKCGGNCPVEQVSWEDAQAFIKRLNQLDPKNQFRLPTEAEWEYACRARTQTPFAFGKCLSTDDANYNGNYPLGGCPKGEYRKKTTPTGSLTANAWGLYDMHGNVYEWCQDWFGDYPTKAVVDPIGPPKGSWRVLRGGGWFDFARNCRSASRNYLGPSFRGINVGFRVLREAP